MVENIENQTDTAPAIDMIVENAQFLRDEILWFASVVNAKLANYLSKPISENEKEKGFLDKVMDFIS